MDILKLINKTKMTAEEMRTLDEAVTKLSESKYFGNRAMAINALWRMCREED